MIFRKIPVPSPEHEPQSGSIMTTSENTSEEEPISTGLSPNHMGYILAALGATCLSMKAIFIKLAYGIEDPTTLAVAPITILVLRMLFSLPAYIIVGTMAYRQRKREQRHLPTKTQIILSILLGLLGYYLSSFLDFTSLAYITAQLERLILFTYPFFTVIFGLMFFGTKITLKSMATLLFAYAGIIFIFFKGEIATGENVLLGSALVLLAAITFALCQLFAKKLINDIGSRLFTCIAMIACTTGIVIHFFITHSVQDLLNISSEVFWLCFLLAIIATILPSFMINAAIERIGPESVAAISILSPMITVIMAINILNEPFGLTDALGTLMVIGGVGLFTLLDFKQKKVS